MNLPLGINRNIASEPARNIASEPPSARATRDQTPKLTIVPAPKPLIDRARELKLKSKALANEVKETVTWQNIQQK